MYIILISKLEDILVSFLYIYVLYLTYSTITLVNLLR
jgi:hypothetical protein